ncbi:hypothetical protein [Planobispora longispora]|uniref:Uncharacterized protein n=1 Tax=Planobispora longispora TaxID=28887 RepID=A0A8J3W1R6_9ACTN|nr:hypothetical protein [Planobispora longispora]GIH73594.1 hypothetical protein Plo01_00230 [Planobispora longispora]
MKLHPGIRLRSAVSEAEIIVIRAPGDEVDLRCGGVPMIPHDQLATPGPGDGHDLLIGKRYSDASGDLEVLVTKAGTGQLTLGGQALTIKAAKALPSSD